MDTEVVGVERVISPLQSTIPLLSITDFVSCRRPSFFIMPPLAGTSMLSSPQEEMPLSADVLELPSDGVGEDVLLA